MVVLFIVKWREDRKLWGLKLSQVGLYEKATELRRVREGCLYVKVKVEVEVEVEENGRVG